MRRKYYPRPHRLRRHQHGATLVEVLVAIALASMFLPILGTALVATQAGRPTAAQQLVASGLLKEAQEAVRVARERNWSTVATDGTYFPAIAANSWTLTAGTQTANGFTRQIVIASVQRDASNTIVASGGTVDPSTKRVTATVSWTTPYAASVSSETILSRWQGSANWTETTLADFTSNSNITNTQVTNTAGGEVQLGTVNVPNWATPVIADTYNTSGTQDALDVYTVGNFAYLCDGTAMNIFNITTPTNVTLVGTYTASGNVSHVFVSGNYAYLSTDSNTAELITVNISNPAAPTLTDSLDLPGTADAITTYVDGTYAYTGRVASTTANSREFQIINVATPATPVLAGGIDYNTGNVNNIKVSGNTAYLATTIDTQEMITVNITNKATPVGLGTFNVPGTADATDLGLDTTMPNYIFLALVNNTGGAEVYTLTVTNPAAPTQTSLYEAGGTVNGISVLGGRAFLSTAIANRQLIVLNVSGTGALSLLANRVLTGTGNDVKAEGDYAYVATTANSEELTVVGPTFTVGTAPSGTYESSTFDAGTAVGFNRLLFTITEPVGTNVQLQVASNTNNATWNYVGPDGTASTFYTAAGAIPLAATGGRYIRYRASLTGTGSNTPTLSDVTVHYSP